MKDLTELLVSQEEILGLVTRMELTTSIIQRHIEEQIIALVDLSEDWYQMARQEFFKGEKLSEEDLPAWLNKKGWSSQDLRLNLSRPEALYRFAKQRFGPGLEERYLSSASDLDKVIYSLVRVKDPPLARELWIRLSEGEASFVDIASQYGEGPEAKRKGLIGPMTIGSLQPPQLRTLLRALGPGEFTEPERLGEWTVLLRLEQLTPSSFDETMRDNLLKEQVEEFVKARAKSLLEGAHLDALHYDPEP